MSEKPASRLTERLTGPGPKRILALDGGGVRGMLTLGILERVEATLRKRSKNPDTFRLCDYFDLIAGTSTGAVIASALSLGMTVKEVQDLYTDLAPKVFRKPRIKKRVKHVAAPYRRRPLIDALESAFKHRTGERAITLGSRHIRTGLLILIQRIAPRSHVWAVLNHPDHRFFSPTPIDDVFPNKDYILSQLVRASSAAPTYFAPERLELGKKGAPRKRDRGVFVDGGVTPFNNPAFAAVMVATLKGYGLNWSLGRDDLLVASIGTGFRPLTADAPWVHGGLYVPVFFALMEDCNWFSQALLQWMSKTATPWRVHAGTQELAANRFGNQEWLTYLRYQVELGPDKVRDRLGNEIPHTVAPKALEGLMELSDYKNLPALLEIGRAVGAAEVKDAHFPKGFDV